MQEEFHGVWNGTATTAWQQKYGWNTLNANVWLPSLSELVGVTGTQNTGNGTYYSAMQGLNTSGYWYVDAQGGEQFAWFQQFNTAGGGATIMSACNQQQAWLRSTPYWRDDVAWHTTNEANMNTASATASYTVHLFVVEGHSTNKPVLLFFSYSLNTLHKIKEIPGEAEDEGRARGISWGSN